MTNLKEKNLYGGIWEIVRESAKKNDVGEIIADDLFGYFRVDQPKSLEDAKKVATFWDDVFKQTKDYVGTIGFVYQEKDKEIPLPIGKKFLKNLGFKIKPKTEEGKVKYESFKPEFVRHVNLESNGLVNCILQKDKWVELNKLAKNTEDFSAPFVMLPENLCYQVNVPLECITNVKYKSGIYPDEIKYNPLEEKIK